MLTIEPTNLHWLAAMPAEEDLCVHGGVVIRGDETVFVDDSHEEWALSAGALFLLRTLDRDHTAESRVAEHLIPHCGHAMYAQVDSDEVTMVGCPHGRDWLVVHEASQVILEFDPDRKLSLSWREWRDAVVQFASALDKFYEDNAPKKPANRVDAEGFAAFRGEWERRMQAA